MDGNSAPDLSAEDAAVAARRREVVDGGVMSFGDHLEELRRCSVRGLIGLLLAFVVSLIFAKRIIAFIVRPALVVLDARGQRPELQALGPPDTFIMYLKMALLCGLILAMPWILMQIWRFVAVGLYSHEKRFVRTLTPISVALFVAGVTFMFFVMLPVVLNYFVAFTENIQIADLRPNFLQSWLVDEPDAPKPVDADQFTVNVPVMHGAPTQAPAGSLWFDEEHNQLCLRGADQVYTIPLQPAHNISPIRNHFSLSEYVSFVLTMALGFGLAFELPLVVVFITAIGLVTADQLAGKRRHVILAIVFAAAILTPSPDVISQVILAIPMLILFEGALFASRRFVHAKSRRAPG